MATPDMEKPVYSKTDMSRTANRYNVAQARLGLGQHPVLLRFTSRDTGELVELAFPTAPLACAHAAQYGLDGDEYEVVDGVY